MGLGQIEDVDVVPDACAVRRIVVGSENADRVPRAFCDLKDDGDQVGFRLVTLSDSALWISARGVEVAECCELDSVRTVVCLKHFFAKELAFAVGIDWVLRVLL